MYIINLTTRKNLSSGYRSLDERQNLIDIESQLPSDFMTNWYEPQSANVVSSTNTSITQESLGSVTHNETESVTKTVSIAKPINLPHPMLTSADDTTDPTIKFYLGKPHKLATGVFTTADGASTFSPFGCFDGLYGNYVMLHKLNGVFAYRLTTVVTLQVNATRFQQGRYILAFLSTGGVTGSDLDDLRKMKKFTATQVTQLPHVELDLASDTQVQLRIPFTSYMSAAPYDPHGYIGDPGQFFIYPYIPVTSPDDVNCGYTMWVHYEDVELYGNCAPQMGDIRTGVGAMVKGVKDVLGKESLAPGPVERTALRVKEFTSEAAKIPLLSAFATPATWLLDAIAGISSIFGWSRPTDVMPVTKVQLRFMHNMAASNEKDVTEVLAQDINNNVGILPGYAGTDQDEMSINFVKKVYAFYKVHTWDAVTTAGTRLFAYPLCPSMFFTNITDSTNTIASHTPVSFLSTLFKEWRGGLKFKFKVVKTEFHSGRLLVAYFPTFEIDGGTLANCTFANSDYVQKTIIDLRMGNEWEFEVPYISPSPYKATGNATDNVTGEAMGYLTCFVLSELQRPDAVSSTVKILVEVCGADDLEFAVPRRFTGVPIIPLAIQASPQMGDIVGDVDTSVLGDSGRVEVGLKNAQFCVGETTSSLRPFIKRCYPSLAMTTNNLNVAHEAIYVARSTTPGATVVNAHDFISLFGCMYAFMRGGTRVRVVTKTKSETQLRTSLYTWPFGTFPLGFVTAAWAGATSPTIVNRQSFASGLSTVQRSDWGMCATIPFYSKTYCKPTLSNWTGLGWSAGRNGCFDQSLLITSDETETPTFEVFRYGADDKDFSGFTGVPPIFIGTWTNLG